VALPEVVRRGAEAKVEAFCLRRVPDHLRDEIELEHTVRGHAITIIKRRLHQQDLGPGWSSSAISREMASAFMSTCPQLRSSLGCPSCLVLYRRVATSPVVGHDRAVIRSGF
jgi:hypothetical protein